ncbi:MAG: C40 family peptidase [Eudoraea sp.]|nr:C40 family peptidase [Eudoraea sp.]
MQKSTDHYGLCALSIVPVRINADHCSEQVTQLLYGDHFKITENRKDWSKIRCAYDNVEGWVCKKQITGISKNDYKAIKEVKTPTYASDLIAFVSDVTNQLTPVMLGSLVDNTSLLQHEFEGETNSGKSKKSNLITTALQYLNAPFQWGGKTPFGIDCSGLSQMVYKINGYSLPRDAEVQAAQGDVLSFVEESEPGDLAFFDNNEGVITHVGIIMKNNYIIHAHGRVRIDRIDQTGIFKSELGAYTHKLRVIKKII